MKIKELESVTGIPRATIRFYEKEGFLSPARHENGYREYSDEDRNILLKIKLLRLLGISVEDVKLLQDGKASVEAVLAGHLHTLQKEEKHLQKSTRVCQEICRDQVRFDTMDAPHYLASYQKAAPEAAAETKALYEQDRLRPVSAPIRRYLARMLDLGLCTSVWVAFLTSVCNINLISGDTWKRILISIAAAGLLLFVEPLFLSLWKTTPGKWILGLSVSDENGGRLSYGDAFWRTKQALWKGLGFSIPVYALVRLWKSWKACQDEETLEWEPGSVLELKDEKIWRGFAYAGATALSIALTIVVLASAQMPKHRGEITVAEFSENYNRLAEYGQYRFGYALDNEGSWVKQSPNTTFIYGSQHLPKFDFTLTEGKIQTISFSYETSERTPSSCLDHMILTALSFACTDDDYGFFSEARKALLTEIESHPFQSYHFSRGGVHVDCEVSHSGYLESLDAGFVVALDESKEHHLSLSFSVTKD